ncbi:hypothetical protein [Nitrosomonas sp. HPC101]|nr:hypothetical protein [Nitrosomonas sp. HPC101]
MEHFIQESLLQGDSRHFQERQHTDSDFMTMDTSPMEKAELSPVQYG